MRKTHAVVVVASITLFAFHFSAAAGTKIVGSGKVVDQVRNVPPFTGVDVAAGIQVKIEAGALSPVALRGEDNVLPAVRTEVKDGRLQIGFEPNTSLHTNVGVSVGLRMPIVESLGSSGGSSIDCAAPATGNKLDIDASGGSHIKASGVDTRNLVVQGSGAAQIQLVGRAGAADVELSGASMLDGAGFAVNGVKISGSGAAKATFHTATQVDGSLSGASELVVPAAAKVNVDVSGGSSVRRRD